MIRYPFTPEQQALFNVARLTWRKRGIAKARRMVFGEETVTDTILLDLAETFPGQLTIRAFNKRQEGNYGADWAWLFQDASGSKNLPILVQAKVLDFADVEYREMSRTIGKAQPAVRQIDRLIDTADGWGWPAIYAFYNHLSDVSRIPHHCSSMPGPGGGVSNPESWGVSIADAKAVRSALAKNDQRFDTHRRHSLPLHCLLCTGGFAVKPLSGSPESVASAIQRLRRLPPRLGLDPPLLPTILSEPPELFRRAIALAELGDEGDRDIGSFTSDYPNIAGVIVLRDGVED